MMSIPKTMENNGEMRTYAKPNKLCISRKVLMRAIQNVLFIEFEPLCQTLWAFLSNFGFFYDARSPNMVISRDPRSKFRKFFIMSHSTFNIRKSHKFSGGKLSTSEIISQKPHEGMENTPLPVPLGLNTDTETSEGRIVILLKFKI